MLVLPMLDSEVISKRSNIIGSMAHEGLPISGCDRFSGSLAKSAHIAKSSAYIKDDNSV